MAESANLNPVHNMRLLVIIMSLTVAIPSVAQEEFRPKDLEEPLWVEAKDVPHFRITLTPDGEYKINGVTFSSDQISAVVKAVLSMQSDARVVIAAPPETPTTLLFPLMKLLDEAGLPSSKIGIIVTRANTKIKEAEPTDVPSDHGSK